MGRKHKVEGGVEVRMLVDYQGLPCNSVQMLDAETADAWHKGGICDTTPEAVEYAKSIAPAEAESE